MLPLRADHGRIVRQNTEPYIGYDAVRRLRRRCRERQESQRRENVPCRARQASGDRSVHREPESPASPARMPRSRENEPDWPCFVNGAVSIVLDTWPDAARAPTFGTCRRPISSISESIPPIR